MRCVECGQASAGLVDGSCVACFSRKTTLLSVPQHVDLELCAHCDARHVGAHWKDPDPGAPLAWLREDAVRETVRVHARVAEPVLELEEAEEDPRNHRVRVRLFGRVEGQDATAQGEVKVRTRRGVCDRCSRMHGGYYAAVVQLRATDRDVSPGELERAHAVVAESLSRQQAEGNRFAFLSKDEPMHGGHDYYVGDVEAARNACRILKDRLGAAVQETAKLVGRQGGEDVYRVTFLARIRLFAAGDFAESGGRVVQVVSIDRGRAHVVDLERHARTRVAEQSLRRIGGAEKVHQAVLVSEDASGLQVLDPVDLRTQDLLRPEGFRPEGATVPVLRHEDRLYLVAVATG